MSGELEKARVRGLTFTEFQGDIISLVRSCISNSYVKYPMLKQFGISKEDLEDQVYCKLYNKSSGASYSNIERYFIKASDMNKTDIMYGPDTKYMVCLIKKVVFTVISQICRTILRKKLQPNISLDGSYNSMEQSDSGDMTYYKGVGVFDKYDKLHYEDVLNQIRLKKYPYYISLPDQPINQLTTRAYLDLLVSGYKSGEIRDSLISIKDSKPISAPAFNKIRKDIMTIAKENLKNYIEG